LFSGLLMAASIPLSGSRGGTIALVVELVFLVTALLLVGKRRHGPFLVGLIVLLITALLVWIDTGRVLDRLLSMLHPLAENVAGMRLNIARDTLAMIRQRPVFGWGAGCFPYVYPHFRTFYTNLLIGYAHNDYLQLAAETGLIGLSLGAWFVVALYRHAWSEVGRSRGQLPDNVMWAALAGCTGILAHSFSDFNLHIPANASLFFALAAIAAACPPSRKRGALDLASR